MGDRAAQRRQARLIDQRFRLEERIGSGGMGEVYRARQLNVGRDVAIKVVRRDRLGDEEAVAQLLREAQIVSQLSSPHSVTLLDVGRMSSGDEREGDAFIVTELIDGLTLRQQLGEGPLSVEHAVDVMDGVAQAVGEAHARGLLHRDIKPSNVMLARSPGHDAFVKVLDFGLAEPIESATTSRIAGTPAYLAPEVIAGKAPTPRADVYAMGVLLFELLVGRPPFEGDKASLLKAHLDDAPPELEDLAPSLVVPAAARDFLRRCLAKPPKLRPRDARAFRDAMLDAFSRPSRALPAGSATSGAAGPDTASTVASTIVSPRQEPPQLSKGMMLGVAGVVLVVAGYLLVVSPQPTSPQPTTGAASPPVPPTTEPIVSAEPSVTPREVTPREAAPAHREPPAPSASAPQSRAPSPPARPSRPPSRRATSNKIDHYLPPAAATASTRFDDKVDDLLD